MPKKKGAVKKRVSKARSTRIVHHRINSGSSDIQIEQVLVENFVSLQKVMTNLSIKFDSLTVQISKLLELFEISAKTMAKKDFELRGGKEDKEMIQRIDNLLEQNKVIARGLTLLHEPGNAMQNPVSMPMQRPPQQIPHPPMQRPPQQMPRPVQNLPPQQIPGEEIATDFQNYQKSMHLQESSGSIFGANSSKVEESKKKSPDTKSFEI